MHVCAWSPNWLVPAHFLVPWFIYRHINHLHTYVHKDYVIYKIYTIWANVCTCIYTRVHTHWHGLHIHTQVHVHILPRKKGDFERNDDIYDEVSFWYVFTCVYMCSPNCVCKWRGIGGQNVACNMCMHDVCILLPVDHPMVYVLWNNAVLLRLKQIM